MFAWRELWGKVIIEIRIAKLKYFEIACKNHLQIPKVLHVNVKFLKLMKAFACAKRCFQVQRKPWSVLCIFEWFFSIVLNFLVWIICHMQLPTKKS
jgi:hypothetical protein